MVKRLNNFDLNSISKNSSIGYILEVNFEYPDELYVLHNGFPLAPEKRAIHYDMLSDYCKKFSDKYGIKVDDVKKLVPNLGDTTNYVLHYRNLQLHLFFGMKLTKIHKVLKFKQSDWMRKLKLMINSVYGKAMENLRKRINVRLVNNKKF